jgi:putative lysine transport system permease protein
MIEQAFNIFIQYKTQFISGAINTILLSFTGTILGLLIGLLLGIIRTAPLSKNKVLFFIQKVIRFLIAAYVEIFRGTPMIVQSMVIYWGYAFANNGNTLNLTFAGILIVSINTGAYLTEIVRGGIDSIDKGQYEGAESIGMSHWQTMFYVIMPQVMRNILPGVSNEFINNIKDTSVLNVIGVAELYFATGKIIRINFEIFETYLVTCIIYLIITFSITRILRFFEKKLEGNMNYKIVNTQSYIPLNKGVKK